MTTVPLFPARARVAPTKGAFRIGTTLLTGFAGPFG